MALYRDLGWLARYTVGTLTAIMVLTIGNPVSGAASHFGSDWANPCDETKDSQCKANNGSHAVNLWDLDSDMEAAAKWALVNRYGTIPGVSVGYYTNETVMDEDVIVKDVPLEDNGDIGYTRCAKASEGEGVHYGGSAANHTRWCRPQIVVFDTTYDRTPSDTRMGYGTRKLRRWLSCHELGHTFGLRHRNDTWNSCMHQYPASRPQYVNLEPELLTHDEDHIEDAYS